MNTNTKLNSLQELEAFQKKLHNSMKGKKDIRIIRICSGGGCIASGSQELAEKLTGLLGKESSEKPIEIKKTGCMGPCSKGTVLWLEPWKILLESCNKAHATEILRLIQLLESKKSLSPQEIASFPFSIVHQGESLFIARQKKIVLKNCGVIDPLSIQEAIGAEVYLSFARLLTHKTPAEKILEELNISTLRGRGGAGFPTWKKWEFTRNAPGKVKYVLCNADEGDPGAFMDRSLLEGDPHSIIEGMLCAAYTIGASQGYVYVRAEYPLAIARLQKALEQARELGLLGKNILSTDFSFDLEIRKGSGAFVCGEETALIHSIEGGRGEPRPRPPFPAIKGLWNKPTVLNNVETYVNVSRIIEMGGEAFATIGIPESRGTKVFALAGAIQNTGLVEVPIGTPLGDLIYDIGGGIKGGRPFKAAQIGGPSGGCIPKEHLNVPLDYESLKKLGAIMGSGGMVVMDDTSCMVDVARYFLEFVQDESCGKCTPCRVGTKRMLEILERICNGEGRNGDIERLIKLGEQIEDTALCGLGQTAPNPVLSTIRHFREEYEAHIRDHHCTAGVCTGLVRASCQSSCPAHVDIPGFVALVGEGRYAEALRLHREKNPFAAVCARVCFHTCEENCQRASIDDPVAIRAIKRFLVDQEVTIQLPEIRENEKNASRKIAIIGAGPAGLSCAYFLARLGYRPTIFEKSIRPGGMLTQTIPAYRLPRETLAREIRMIEHMGVDIIMGKSLGVDFTFTSLKEEGFEAIFTSIGAPDSLSMGLPGESCIGVVQAIPFLQEYNIRGSVRTGKHVIVIGGGNAAIDAARTALRLGAEQVQIIYRRSREEMPAYEEEVEEAVHEGIKIDCLTQPIEIISNVEGRVSGLRCMGMRLGSFDESGRRSPVAESEETFLLETDHIIMAIGQRIDAQTLRNHESPHAINLNLNSRGFILADPVTGITSDSMIFAGGDCVEGPSSVVKAIASGERGAVGIDLLLTGKDHAFWRTEKEIETAYNPDADSSTDGREPIKTIAIERRRENFEEVELSWTESIAQRQAKRCLRCDYGKQVKPPIPIHSDGVIKHQKEENSYV